MTNDTLSPEPEAAEVPAPRRRSFRLPEEIGVIVALLVMIVVIGVARPRFLNPINLLTILGNTTFEGMLSLGMVFLLAIREIDLSVGWMFNFSAVVAALMMVAGFNPWLAALAGVGFGAVLGLVNGVLAIGLGLPSIIVTLGTYSMFEGLSLVANQGRAVPTKADTGSGGGPNLSATSSSNASISAMSGSRHRLKMKCRVPPVDVLSPTGVHSPSRFP